MAAFVPLSAREGADSGQSGRAISQDSSLILAGETHFRSIRQLTFHGENAEAYFSPDGRRLIFQSHIGAENCDRIFVMDLVMGKTEPVSSGQGVTTCSYFRYPDGGEVTFSSTHLADALCPPRPDPLLGYVWPLHPSYDIYAATLGDSALRRLTDSPGYDAEATFSFDGKRIIYTSLASGDLDLWTMNPDGTDKRQLTHRPGYDGGAFFSHDGRKIVWRAHYPESEEEAVRYRDLLAASAIRPMALQLWVMNADGTEPRQVTRNSGANFGPFFHPDDRRIIFSSNLANPRGRNFDLYSIKVDGTDLRQITTYDGFDGFPMFSPDGRYLVFASNRNQAAPNETNLFLAEWID